MADAIMKAFVQFRADDTGLKQDAEAKVKTATEGLAGKAKIELDTSKVDTQRKDLQAKLSALGSRATQIRANLDVNDKAGLAKVAQMQVRLAALDKRTASPKITLEGAARAEAQILSLDAQLDALGRKDVHPKIKLDTSGVGKELAAGTAAGMGPGILGVSAKNASIVAGGASLLAAVPALAAIQASVAVIGSGIGLIVSGAQKLIGTDKAMGPLFAQAQNIAKTYQDTLKNAAGGMLEPLKTAFGQIPGMIKNLAPAIKDAFAGAGTMIQPLITGLYSLAKDILPSVGAMFRAAAPSIQPLLSGIGSLVKGLMPGLIAIMKSAQPAFAALSSVLGTLGKGIGTMMSAMAPAMAASSVIFKALGDVLAALFPVIGNLASVFAQTLAPVFVQFAGIIKALMPVFTIIGKVIADFAKAVMTDLVAAFGAVSQLIKAVSPSLQVLATALGNVFQTLENSGVFAIFGDALEAIVPVLATFINTLVRQLAPFLPTLIGAFARLGSILITVLATGLSTILGGLTSLMKTFPLLVPVLATAAVAWGVLNAVMALNPFVAIGMAIIALVGAFTLLWQKSAGFRDAIKLIGVAFLDVGIVIVSANQKIVDAVLSMIGTVLHGLAKLPAILGGNMFKTASKNFDDFKAHVDGAFNSTIGVMQGWRSQLDGTMAAAKAGIGTVVTAFQNQAKASDTAKAALDRYTQAVQANGAGSTAAKAARDTLVQDLIKAGVDANTAHADVAAYTTAITQNGVSSTAAGAARAKLAADILSAAGNARQGQADLNTYTAAVQNNGAQSTAAQGARAQLIADLQRAGMNAHDATALVDGLGSSIARLPAKTDLHIDMTGTGSFTITQGTSGSAGGTPTGGKPGYAAGGYITGGIPGRDSVLISAMPGEVIVPVHMVRAGAVDHLRGRLPGFAKGGAVGGISVDTAFPQRFYDQFKSQMTAAMIAAMRGAIAKAAAAATAAMSGAAAGTAGAGVQQWRALVLKALAMLGLPASLVDAVLYQMQTESGGNARAINLWDSNAAAGHPSKGLMQVIDSTFAAYHVAGTSNDIYDPLANIAAALNYAMHNKGFGSGPGQVGSGHGYDRGGWLPPGLSVAYNGTGRPERVIPPGGVDQSVTGRLDRLAVLLERLIGTTAAVPAATGHHLCGALSGAAGAAAFRARYPAGGIR